MAEIDVSHSAPHPDGGWRIVDSVPHSLSHALAPLAPLAPLALLALADCLSHGFLLATSVLYRRDSPSVLQFGCVRCVVDVGRSRESACGGGDELCEMYQTL